jgi:hypothetical protein
MRSWACCIPHPILRFVRFLTSSARCPLPLSKEPGRHRVGRRHSPHAHTPRRIPLSRSRTVSPRPDSSMSLRLDTGPCKTIPSIQTAQHPAKLRPGPAQARIPTPTSPCGGRSTTPHRSGPTSTCTIADDKDSSSRLPVSTRVRRAPARVQDESLFSGPCHHPPLPSGSCLPTAART